MYFINLFLFRSSDEGEGIDPNAAFVKKSKKKTLEATPSLAKAEHNTFNSQQTSSKKSDPVSVCITQCYIIYNVI